MGSAPLQSTMQATVKELHTSAKLPSGLFSCPVDPTDIQTILGSNVRGSQIGKPTSSSYRDSLTS